MFTAWADALDSSSSEVALINSAVADGQCPVQSTSALTVGARVCGGTIKVCTLIVPVIPTLQSIPGLSPRQALRQNEWLRAYQWHLPWQRNARRHSGWTGRDAVVRCAGSQVWCIGELAAPRRHVERQQVALSVPLHVNRALFGISTSACRSRTAQDASAKRYRRTRMGRVSRPGRLDGANV